MERKKNNLNEVITINGNKILLENGDIKNIIDENNQNTDYMDVETAFEIINNEIDMIYNDEL